MSRKTPARMLMRGPARDAVAADLKARYEAGASIRAIAESTQRSYGAVHGLLRDAGAVLRSRGGAKKEPSTT